MLEDHQWHFTPLLVVALLLAFSFHMSISVNLHSMIDGLALYS